MTPEILEDRLIEFSASIIDFSKHRIESFAAEHLLKQIIRSSSSSALNYGEARGAQSTKDFIHKLRICLKELRESLVNLKIQKKANLSKDIGLIGKLITENNELVAIFVSTIKKLEKS